MNQDHFGILLEVMRIYVSELRIKGCSMRRFSYGVCLGLLVSLSLSTGPAAAFPIHWEAETVHALPDQQMWLLQPNHEVNAEEIIGLAEVLRMRIEHIGVESFDIKVRGHFIAVSCPTSVQLPTDWESLLQLKEPVQLRFKTEILGTVDGEEMGVGWKDTDITHDDISVSKAVRGENGTWSIEVTLNSEGAKKFATLTAENLDKPIGIFINDLLISAPVVRSPIMNGVMVIDNSFSAEEARRFAALFRVPNTTLRLVEKTIVAG